MIRLRQVPKKSFKDYEQFLTESSRLELVNKALEFAGKKIVHINATPKGGGVVEILDTLVGLERDLGMDSQWFYFEASPEFFEFTKKLHNALQGAPFDVTEEEKNIYVETNKALANELESLHADVIIIHDPQPMASISFMKPSPAVLRLHMDLTAPDSKALEFVKPYFDYYKKVIFSVSEFVPAGMDKNKVIISAPAIDPLNTKNFPLEKSEVDEILKSLDIDPKRPLVTQLSRFDHWKDYPGVLEAYAIAKKQIPDLQLALAGVIEAQDDPEALLELATVKAKASDLQDVHIFSDEKEIGERDLATFVNALQSGSDVILQKSTREGFGLTVTEAMWKKRPVIGGNVGGIKKQIKNEVSGFLVETIEEAGERIVELVNNPLIAHDMGVKAHLSVKDQFLITRLLQDELSIMKHAVKVQSYKL